MSEFKQPFVSKDYHLDNLLANRIANRVCEFARGDEIEVNNVSLSDIDPDNKIDGEVIDLLIFWAIEMTFDVMLHWGSYLHEGEQA